MDPEPDERQTRELQSFMECARNHRDRTREVAAIKTTDASFFLDLVYRRMENQKAVIQAAISKLTETCFDKCVQKPGNKLDSSEANCIGNCAGRYLDSSVFVVNRMMARRQQQQ